MSRRLLMGSSKTVELPSKIVFKMLANSSTLEYNISGTNITLKDKDGTVLASVASGFLPNISVPNTTDDNVFTIEAEKLNSCNFQYAPRLKTVLEFTVPNKNTNIRYCFNNCNSLQEVRNIAITENTDISYMFSNCPNLTIIDSFYIKPKVNATYAFMNTKITNNPILNIEEVGDATGLFLGSLINDISSMQNKDLQWTAMSGFVNNTPITVLQDLRFTKVSNLSFTGSTSITTINNIEAPVAGVMSFSQSPNLVQVSNINAPMVTNLYNCFGACEKLETITNFTTGAINNVSYCFSGCVKLTTIPNLNLYSELLDFNGMFENCYLLNSFTYYFNHIANYSGINKLNCTGMFAGCRSLTTLPSLNYDKIVNANAMFSYTGITEISNINITAVYITNIFTGCNQLLSINNVSFTNCYNADYIFQNCSKLQTASVTVNSNTVNLSCRGIFSNCPLLTNGSFTCTSTSDVVDLSSLFESCPALTTFAINMTNNQLYIASGMFLSCTSLSDISSISWSRVKKADNMFFNCFALTEVTNFNMVFCENVSSMFANCKNLISIGTIYLPVATLTTNFLSGCEKLETITNLNMPSTTDVSYLFNNCYALTSVGTLQLDNATQAQYMFLNCRSLASVNLSTAPKITHFDSAFNGCYNLQTAVLSLVKAVSYTNCFSGCDELLTVTIADSDSSVTQINTSGMFRNCLKLTTVNMNLSKIYQPQEMFLNCGLLDMDISNLTLTNIGNCSSMFYSSGLKSITNLSISTSSGYAPYCDQMFFNCQRLTSINGLTITSNAVNSLAAFNFALGGCTNLTSLSNLNLNGPLSVRGFLQGTGLSSINLSLLNITNDSYCEYFLADMLNLTSVPLLEVGGYAETLIANCTNITDVGDIRINSSYATNKTYVIANCPSVVNIDEIISNADKQIGIRAGVHINKITVPNCYELTLESANLESVNEIVGNSLTSLTYFASSTKLANFPIMNTSNVTNYFNAFNGTKVVTYNNNYDLSKAVQLIALFSGCSELTSVTMSDNFTASSVYTSSMFAGCPKLTSVTITNASKLRDMSTMFYNSNNITDLVLNGFTSGFPVPPAITDVGKLEALINSAGTNAVPSENIITLGSTRLATISTTVKNNATAKGWILQ